MVSLFYKIHFIMIPEAENLSTAGFNSVFKNPSTRFFSNVTTTLASGQHNVLGFFFHYLSSHTAHSSITRCISTCKCTTQTSVGVVESHSTKCHQLK